MRFTPAEKIIIQLLCDIHKHLKVDGELDADFISKALSLDSWALNWRYSSLYTSEDVTDEDPAVGETANILDMYRQLGLAYERLDAAEKKVFKDAGFEEKDLQFPGFDANNDRHYGIAKFMIEDLGRFESFKGQNLNSHWSLSISEYRSMLPEFRETQRSVGMSHRWSANQIARVLKSKNVD